jgi:hypothetical protein
VITNDDTSKYALVAAVQNVLAGAFSSTTPLASLKSTDGGSLLQEIRGGAAIPRHLILDFTPMLDLLPLTQIGAMVAPATGEFIPIAAILKVLKDPTDEITRIFSGSDPASISSRLLQFFDGKHELKDLSGMFGSFLEGQFGIALSLVTTLKNLVDPALPRLVTDSVMQYFFGPDGFSTVDEISIAPPANLSGMPKSLGELKGFLSEKNAERYVRDIVSVVVEASGDFQYKLRDRYGQMTAGLNAAQQETAKRWFKGFAAMAEAGLSSAVEETLLGIGSFQGNKLVAASAGAYAGTAARKMTQHVFLSEMAAGL